MATEYAVGFDMVPLLSNDDEDQELWGTFLDKIEEEFENSDVLEIKHKYFLFHFGNNPCLPFEGYKFMRFSTNLTVDSLARGYVSTILAIAKECFNARAKTWSEMFERPGIYGSEEVNRSIATYGTPGGPGITPTSRSAFASPGSTRGSTTITLPTIRLNAVSTSHDDWHLQSSNASRRSEMDPANPHLWEIRPVPNKGMGLISRSQIRLGMRILAELPLFKVVQDLDDLDFMESEAAAKLKLLPKHLQREFLSLANSFPGKRSFSGIVRTNAFPVMPEQDKGGIFLVAARINHACVPNAFASFNADTGYLTVQALRDIRPGEEITLQYDQGLISEIRRQFLWEEYGIECKCATCALRGEALRRSDLRRRRIDTLDLMVTDDNMVMRPDQCMSGLYNATVILDDEYNGTAFKPLARVYYDAMDICLTHGDLARAKVFGERAYKANVIAEGFDAAWSMSLRLWVGNLSTHPNYNAEGLWKTSVEDAPTDHTGCSQVELERWLWARGR